MPPRLDQRNFSGREKAAIVILSLGEEYAAPLLNGLDDEEIAQLSSAMASVGNVHSTIVERVLVDFVSQFSGTGAVIGSLDTTQRLLSKHLPEDRVNAILSEIHGPAGRTMWDKLGNVNEKVLANYLKNEHPQTVAVILSKLRSDHAARVLNALSEDYAIDVIMRMVSMEPVQKEILNKLEETLRVEFMSNLARTARRDPFEVMAEIFNGFDRSTETRFLLALEQRNAAAAERIKSLMFTFEDLSRLDPTGVQALLRIVEKDKLSLALKGASESIRDMFFSNMSERAGRILREDMEAMGPVRLRDVDEAQAHMVQTAKQLAEAGEIVLAGSQSEEELVY